MKFKFCGDLDAPDWLLLEIATLSKVGTVNFKLMVMQVMAELLGGEIDYAKLEKALSDASDIKASVAALAFILNSAARYDIENGLLTNELQQLGLPKEHSDSLCRPYQEQKEKLRTQAAQNSLRLPRLEHLDWRVDYIISSSNLKDVAAPSATLKVKRDDGKEIGFEVSAEKFAVLYSELTTARAVMDTVD